MHSTTKINKAHREDLNWIKVGKREYMNGSGEILRFDAAAAVWRTFNAKGEAGMTFLALWVAKESVADGFAFRYVA